MASINICKNIKINFIPQIILEILLIHHFEVLRACLNVFNYVYLKCLNHCDGSVDIYPHTKMNFTSSFHLENLDGFSRIPQSHWPRAFWAIAHKQEFIKMWSFWKQMKNYKHFHVALLSIKSSKKTTDKPKWTPILLLLGITFALYGVFSENFKNAKNRIINIPNFCNSNTLKMTSSSNRKICKFRSVYLLQSESQQVFFDVILRDPVKHLWWCVLRKSLIAACARVRICF